MKLLSIVFATAVIFSVHGADQRPNTPPQIVISKVCPSAPKKIKPAYVQRAQMNVRPILPPRLILDNAQVENITEALRNARIDQQ